MAGNQVSIKITADDQASKKIKGVGDEAKKSSTDVGGLGNALKSMGTIVGALQINQVFNSALGSVKSFVGGAVSAASNVEEAQNKVNAVFRDQSGIITAWAAQAATDFGQSKLQALDAAGAFGNMFVQLGFAGSAAADMSMQMTELASDFASFHNADITEVLLAQQAAFRGEYDAVQRFVPTINAAAVELQALAETGKENAKQLTAQEKAHAAYTLILQNAGDAVGDFDATSKGLANTQRTLTSEMANLQAALGEKLLPIQLAVTKAMLDAIPEIEKLASAFVDTLGPAIADVADIMQMEFLPALENVIDATATGIREMRQNWDTIGPFVEAALAPVFAVFGVLVSQLEFVADAFRGFAALLRGDWSNAWRFFANAALAMIQGIVNPIIDGFNLIVKAYNETIGRITGQVSEIPEFTFRFNIEGPVAGGGFLGGIMDDVRDVVDGIVDMAKTEAPRIPAAIADGIKKGGGAIKDAVKEVLEPIPDEIIDLANYAEKALSLFSEGFADEAQHLLDEDALGRAGAQVMDNLVIALTTGSDKALGQVGAGLAGMVDEVRKHEAGGAAAAAKFSQRLTDAMTKVIKSGGREGVDELRKVLEDMNDVLDGPDANKVFNAAKTFSEALTEALFNEEMEDKLGRSGAGIIQALQKGMAEKNPGMLEAAARDAAALIEVWEDELGGPRANAMGKQFKVLLEAYVKGGGDAALKALMDFFAAANAQLQQARTSASAPVPGQGGGPGNPTWGTVNWNTASPSTYTAPDGTQVTVWPTASGWTTGDSVMDAWIQTGRPGETLAVFQARTAQNAGGGFGAAVPGWGAVPQMAAGGIVTRPTLAMIGERGPEAVVPLGRGGVGTNITIQALDAQSFEDWLRRGGGDVLLRWASGQRAMI